MLQNHKDTCCQNDTYDARFQSSQNSLHIGVLQQFFQQDHDEQDNNKRGKHHCSCGNKGTPEACL